MPPILVAAVTLLSGVVGAIGSLQQAAAAKAAGEYEAAVAERNKKIALQQAEAEMVDQRRENRRQLSQIRALYGSSGLELAGSPLDVIEDSAAEGAYDVEKVGYQGKLRAIEQTDKANLARMKADSASKAGYIGAAGNLLAGFTRFSSTSAGASLLRA